MKQTKRKKKSAVIPALLGITATLVVLVSIMGCSAANQKNGKEQPAAEAAAADAGVYPAEYQVQFEPTWKMNQDFKGYLTLEGTALSTNVVQGTDNTFYREHGFDGSTDSRIAFLDYRANIEAPSTQLLIYLPNANIHEKYGELANFKNLEYYKEHPVISFNSLYANAKYKVFSVAVVPAGSEKIPYQSCMETSDRAQMITLVQKAMDHSILEIPVDVRDSDELLTVITEDLSLVDANGEYARIIVFARKVRSGESDAVNTQKVVIKPNKYLPDSWYNQILHGQYASAVNQEIRKEAANWFSAFELSKIADADLERMMNARKAEYKKYLSEQEMLLSAEEKAYLYEKRLAQAENPELVLDIQNLTARVGDKVTLNVTRSPQDPAAAYTWSSSNDSVVSVEGNGASAKLSIRKEGKATITVSSAKSSVSCNVEVKAKEEFVLNPSSMTIFVDNSYNIKASSDIEKATSSDKNVAKVTVNKNTATVYGVKPGEATITVTGKNGMSATCKVTVKKYQLTLDKTTLEMKPGNRRNIYVSTGAAENWYVDNTNVVKMSVVENGKAVLVEAVGSGTATVTATARNGAQASCKITVADSGVALSSSYMDLSKGETKELRVTQGNVAKWEVSNKAVADVYVIGDGSYAQVEGRGYGSTTVKAIGNDGSVATLTVNVSEPKQSLTITPYSMTVTAGELRNITVTSGSASNWVSSNPDVAEVYVIGNGSMAQVEGRKPGTATITVYDQYGGWVHCNVTVEAAVPKLVIGPGTMYMNVGDWEELTVASGKAVDWKSSNDSVVGIYIVGGDMNNVRIKGNGAGTAQVIAYAEDGSTAVCNVTVEAPYVEELALDKSSMTVTVGEWHDLRVTSGYAVDWSSSNSNVVGVYVIGDDTNNVKIKGFQAGSSTVTAYAADGSSVTCKVTVEDPYVAPVVQDPLTLAKTNLVLTEGDWYELKVTSGTCVNWNTTNPNIVRLFDVNEPNMIKLRADSAGTCEIIAYASDGTTTICKVTVNPYVVEIVDPDPVFFTEPATEPTVAAQPETVPAPENTDDNAADDFEND